MAVWETSKGINTKILAEKRSGDTDIQPFSMQIGKLYMCRKSRNESDRPEHALLNWRVVSLEGLQVLFPLRGGGLCRVKTLTYKREGPVSKIREQGM